ncbi:hypothetical protein DEU56DRAFT_811897, partial [Suillus clintonianus]|uniref:uncharacterized protein n=1 Tax=Suillus clintonianus TaxID=1904413 RepID=UPI001B85D6BC
MDSSLACMFHSLLYVIIDFLSPLLVRDRHWTHSLSSRTYLWHAFLFLSFPPRYCDLRFVFSFSDTRRTTGLVFIMDSSLACTFILYIIFFDFFLDWYETISDSFSFITNSSICACGIDLSFFQS